MSDNDIDDLVPSIRKRTSLIWQYFQKLSRVRVKCRICQHEQRYMGNTANALRHLKVKHDIDARAIGLEDPRNVERMKALSISSASLEQTKSVIKSESSKNYDDTEEMNEKIKVNRPSRKGRYTRIPNKYEEETDVDPYSTDNEPLVDFIGTNNYSQGEVNQLETSSTTRQRDKMTTLKEKRIMAEIEYYREKAAYFRIQKHLAALQAKKVKYELDQMYGK